MPFQLFPNTKRNRDEDLSEITKYVHFANLAVEVSDAESSNDEEDYEEEPDLPDGVDVGLQYTDEDVSNISPEAQAALEALRTHEGQAIIPLTLPLLEVLLVAGRDLSFIVVYDEIYSSATARGCQHILSIIIECRRRKRYFDTSKLHLYIVLMDDALFGGGGGENATANPRQSAFRVFSTMSSNSFLHNRAQSTEEGAAIVPPQDHQRRLLLPLQVMARIVGLKSARKHLWSVGSFWSPFLLNLLGDITVNNVIDFGVAVGVCNSVPACAFDSTTAAQSGFDGSLNDELCTAMSAEELQKREQNYISQMTKSDEVHGIGFITENQILKTSFGICELQHDILTSLSNGPSAGQMTQTIRRESKVLHAMALLQHNGLLIDVDRGVHLLRAFVKRSQDLHAAIEMLLESLRGTQRREGTLATHTTARADAQQEAIKHPMSDQEVIELITKYTEHFVTQPDVVSTHFSLMDQDLIAHCPLAAAWVQLQKLRSGGIKLQRFIAPLRDSIVVHSEPNSTASRHAAFPKDKNRLPLCTVNPVYNAVSATGRIFTSKPNLQTVPSHTFVVTSGSTEGDAAVQALLAKYFSASTTSSSASELPISGEPTIDLSHFTLPALSVNLRSLLVAPPGCKMISIDFNQIELRVLAHLSRDPALLSAFGVGLDNQVNIDELSYPSTPHTGSDVLRFVAQLMFKRSSPEAITLFERSQAKVVVYGMLYGMGDAALQARLESAIRDLNEQEEVKNNNSSHGTPISAIELRSAFRRAFPVAADYIQQVGTNAILSRTASSIGGRYRHFQGTDVEDSNAAQYSVRTKAVSMVIQGSAADILKAALCEAAQQPRAFKHDTSADSTSNNAAHGTASSAGTAPQPTPCYAVVMTLHDELLFIVPDEVNTIRATVKYLTEIMEGQAKVFDLILPLRVSVKIGPSFGELAPYLL